MGPGFSERTFDFCYNVEYCQLNAALLANIRISIPRQPRNILAMTSSSGLRKVIPLGLSSCNRRWRPLAPGSVLDFTPSKTSSPHPWLAPFTWNFPVPSVTSPAAVTHTRQFICSRPQNIRGKILYCAFYGMSDIFDDSSLIHIQDSSSNSHRSD